MPTILSHLAVPISVAVALGPRRVSWGMLAAGMVAAVLPDADSVAFKLGIPYGGMWGHRGFTHTLGFALVVGLLGWWAASRWRIPRGYGYAWIALCVFSHPVLDTLTNGGLAIALYWPLTDTRFFSPWRPVVVSPVDFRQFVDTGGLSLRGSRVLLSELMFIWLPLLGAACGVSCLRWLTHLWKKNDDKKFAS